MPFRIKLRRSRRYNVLSKNYFVTQIRLLDANVIECTLSVESTGQECLEAVAQRLELRETHYFGLWFHSKTQVQRWVELEKPLKKQLDKFGSETLLFFAVMYYVPSVSRLEQEITRYQYYLQVKKDVLDGRLPCTVEQGIRLAGFAVQADFGDFTRYLYQDFLREYVLFPVNWPHVDEVLEEWTQKVAEEHKSHYQLQPAEAELLYIKEVEKLDGFGQESFAAKDNYTNDIFIGVSFIGVFVKHRNGRSIMLHRWKDIGTIGHNKSAITVEITRKDDTIMFHTEDIEMAKYIARLFTARHKFYKQNKICAEQDSSPETVRRRPTWNRLPRPQSCILPSQYDHYQDTQSSQDSIFHDDPYYKSESSLLELGFRNGPVPNGSVCSSPSASSLSRSQTFAHGSPVSSNPSLPSGELTRPDYAPSHRHSAIIAPSYRPTPEYDAVMRQKHRLLPATPSADLHSQSLRSLNISNAFAYRRPEALVYSQPEMRERGLYHAPYGGGGGGGPQPAYGPPAGPSSAPLGPGVPPMAGQASCAPGNGISHTVSTPELANTKQQQAGGAGQAGEVPHGPAAGGGTAGPRGRPSRPPPPYPAPFRPATSTPDLVSHRQRGVGGSSPETVTRKVQLSVKTFQPDSSSVVRQSLQEASELLTHAARRAVPSKGTAFALPRRNTQRDQAPPLAPPPARESPRPKSFRHQKTPSNVTMLVHSSESEEEEEEEYPPELDIHIPGLNEDIDARLQAALASIPNKPPPEYPGPRSGSADRALRHRDQDQGRPEAAQGRARAKATGGGPRAGHGAASGPPPRAEQACLGGALLGPSISEPDLTSVKERVRKEPVKERPVSEMFSIEDSIVERECAQRTLERQMKLVDSMKRPLMMATLNGLYVTRMPAPENARAEGTKVSADEQWRHLELRLEEEALFTEYERVPKKAAERSVTTAALPENAERNRFRDVVPYEDTRVELVPSKDNNMGYINASHVRMMVRGEERHYIATQGPLPNTCHDFWQMVWEQGVNVIAMVTAEEEGGRSKSHRYWPKLGSKHNSATHGKFKVTTKFRTDSGCYATTGLKVKHLLSGQERTVWHLQYTDWPEHGCPEYVQGFLSYLEEIQSVRRHTNSMLDTSKSLNPPVVVHCSAGVGRTGVVILTELMLSAMEHNEKVEVPVMLGWLRHQRMLMVQTMTQYKFVYQVLIQFLKSSRLI